MEWDENITFWFLVFNDKSGFAVHEVGHRKIRPMLSMMYNDINDDGGKVVYFMNMNQ